MIIDPMTKMVMVTELWRFGVLAWGRTVEVLVKIHQVRQCDDDDDDDGVMMMMMTKNLIKNM